uniref:Uncharacterized protein n=1 Tax=Helianthus annuus TaxID=4232 RepID=A0A251TJ85_HELAN
MANSERKGLDKFDQFGMMRLPTCLTNPTHLYAIHYLQNRLPTSPILSLLFLQIQTFEFICTVFSFPIWT